MFLPSNISEFYRSRTRWGMMQIRHELPPLERLLSTLHVFLDIWIKRFRKSISCPFKNTKIQFSPPVSTTMSVCQSRVEWNSTNCLKGSKTWVKIFPLQRGGLSLNRKLLIEEGIFVKILAIHLLLIGV